MATAQEAQDARLAAVDELARLLQSPDDLKRLTVLREEYAAKRQATKAQLSAALTSQVDATCAGLEVLETAHQALRRLQQSFVLITSLCAECQSLVDSQRFAKIRQLSTVHLHLHKTLGDAEAVAALPQEAADAEALLRDSGAGLVQAYVRLAALEATGAKARWALEAAPGAANGGAAPRGARDLSAYFAQVQRSMAQVEERLWSTVRAYRILARRDPGALVAALQVVEMQEAVDAHLLPAGQSASGLRKRWRYRCLEHVSSSIQEEFAPLLQRCSQLAAAGGDAALADVLRDADAFVQQLAEAPAAVAPCFPPRFRILPFLCGEYHRHVASVIDLAGLSAEQLTNAEVLAALAWVQRYQGRAAQVGAGPDGLNLDDGPGSGVALLMDKYMQRVGATLDNWLVNIVEADVSREPLVTGEGRMWTPGAVDLFRILDEQVAVVVAARAGGPMLLRVGAEAVAAMRAFQASCRARLGELPLEHLCAVANNNLRCHALGREFAARLNAMCADAGVEGQVSVLEACQDFVDLAHAAAAACVRVVFSDPGVEELIARVACTEQWERGVTASSIVATLDDFLQDFERWLDPTLFQAAAELTTAEAVAHYVAALVTQLRAVREEDLRALRRDASRLAAFFARFSSPARAARACQPLDAVAEFLASDSVESFELAYTAMLQSAPGITPTLLSSLLTARVARDRDMTKADAKEVLETCRGVYQTWKADRGGEEAGGGAAAMQAARPKVLSGRDATFNAALNAARKRPVGADAADSS